jgi:ferredoxin
MGTFCVVTEPCRDCVCPTECFYQDDHMLYIDPDECINCQACIPECPVVAIFEDDVVPTKWQHFIELNAERARALKDRGHITEKQEPLVQGNCSGAVE